MRAESRGGRATPPQAAYPAPPSPARNAASDTRLLSVQETVDVRATDNVSILQLVPRHAL
eukprot:5299619-Pleurochrysis_carterae.AAC.1